MLDLTRRVKASDELVSSLQLRLESKKYEVESFRDEFEPMKLHIEAQAIQIVELERMLLERTGAAEVAEAELSDRLAQIDAKDAQLCEMQQLCDSKDADSREAIERLNGELSCLTQLQEAATAKDEAALATQVHMAEEAEGLRSTVHSLNHASAALQQELDAARAQIEELRAKDAVQLAQQAEAAAHIGSLERSIQEHEGLMHAKNAAAMQLQQETKSLKAENNELRRSMQSMNQASTALQQELVSALGQLDATRAQMEQLMGAVQAKDELLRAKDSALAERQAEAAAQVEVLQRAIRESEASLAQRAEPRGAPDPPELSALVDRQDAELKESRAKVELLEQRVEALKEGATRAMVVAVAEQKAEAETLQQIEIEAKNEEIRDLRRQLASCSKVEQETDEIQEKLQVSLFETQEKKADLQCKLASLQNAYGLRESELSLSNARVLNLQAELEAALQAAESSSVQIAKFEMQIRSLDEATTAETTLWRTRALSAMEFLEAQASSQEGPKLLASSTVAEMEAERRQLKSSVVELERHASLMTERLCAAEKLLNEERACRAQIQSEQLEAITDAKNRLQLSELQCSQLRVDVDAYKAALAKLPLLLTWPSEQQVAVVEADSLQLKQALESSKLAIEFYDAKVLQCERQLEALAAFHSETEQAAVAEIRSLRSAISAQKVSILDLTSQVSAQAIQATLHKTMSSISNSQPRASADARSELEQVFDEIDANHDGHLSRAELIHAVRESQSIADLLGLPRHIRQEDGTRDMFETIFRQLDTNDDKMVSKAEFIHFFEKHRTRESHSNTQAGAAASPMRRPTDATANRTADLTAQHAHTGIHPCPDTEAFDSCADQDGAWQQVLAAATLKAALESQWCVARELDNARHEAAAKDASMRAMQAKLDDMALTIELNDGPLEAARDERVDSLWSRVVELESQLESSHFQLKALSTAGINEQLEMAHEEITGLRAEIQRLQAVSLPEDTLGAAAPTANAASDGTDLDVASAASAIQSLRSELSEAKKNAMEQNEQWVREVEFLKFELEASWKNNEAAWRDRHSTSVHTPLSDFSKQLSALQLIRTEIDAARVKLLSPPSICSSHSLLRLPCARFDLWLTFRYTPSAPCVSSPSTLRGRPSLGPHSSGRTSRKVRLRQTSQNAAIWAELPSAMRTHVLQAPRGGTSNQRLCMVSTQTRHSRRWRTNGGSSTGRSPASSAASMQTTTTR